MGESTEQHLVVMGLGNPGKRYTHTRHNMGYLVVQALAEREAWSFKEEGAFHALVAKGKKNGVTVHLLLPLTYMNLSGRAAKSYLDFFKIIPERLVVVHDEFALAFGQPKLQVGGGAGGHNGLKSLMIELQTPNFVRLRIGIGGIKGEKTLADYVLEGFNSEETQQLPLVIDQGVETIRRLMNEEIPAVMNSINVKRRATPA